MTQKRELKRRKEKKNQIKEKIYKRYYLKGIKQCITVEFQEENKMR